MFQKAMNNMWAIIWLMLVFVTLTAFSIYGEWRKW